jgi:hypothetical protein
VSFVDDWGYLAVLGTVGMGAIIIASCLLLGPLGLLVGLGISALTVFGGWLIARAVDRGFGGRP